MGALFFVEGRRGMKPLMLKAGLALALSFAGYIFSQIRSRQAATNRRRLLPPPGGTEGRRNGCGGSELKEELSIMKHEGNSPNASDGTVAFANARVSQTNLSLGDEEGYLLPEFNELLQEFKATEEEQDTQTTHTSISTGVENMGKLEMEHEIASLTDIAEELQERKSNSTEQDSQTSHASTSNGMMHTEKSEMEQEIAHLRDMVESLQEREKNLEFQLLEYYGLKEQDAALRELENRLKIGTVEAKLLALKIESLQADNRRLEAELLDQSKVVAELEASKEMINVLKKKLRFDSEQAEQMVALQERVAALEVSECADREQDEDVEQRLKRLKDLENVVVDLRKENSRLAQVNLDLTKKLESSQVAASTNLDKLKVTDAWEEVNRMRMRNEELSKELEQLQTDRCTDVEELVYLRWVNACLRYELRNYHPTGGRTVARDLSKGLSPRSEERAKKLILEYASSGNDEKFLTDFDSEYCSSQESSVTDIEEHDDNSVSMKNRTSSSKIKFISKLKKLVLGKASHKSKFSSSDGTPTSCSDTARKESISACSFEDARYSFDSLSSYITMDNALENRMMTLDDAVVDQDWQKSRGHSRPSLDFHKLRTLGAEETRETRRERCKSDLGSTFGNKSLLLGEQSLLISPLHDQFSHDSREKAELKKFAGVLKSNRWSSKSHKKSVSK